jgi:hypothetical protein
MSNSIKVTSNKSKRTYTIYKDGVKYRTVKLSKEEFENFAYHTDGDWRNFFREYAGWYYIIK